MGLGVWGDDAFVYFADGSEGLHTYSVDATMSVTDARVGIGTDRPARVLHVCDVMRLEPRATAPPNPSKGDIYMDDVTSTLRCHDGTSWQDC